MSVISKRTVSLAAVLSVVLFGGVAAALDMVPLKGKFEGTGANFSGTFTHLGRFTGVIDPSTGAAVWTAANGDTVNAQTTSFVLLDEVEPGVFFYEQTLVVTGGGGRFASASGSARVTGLFDVTNFSYDGLLDGTISRPNSQ